MKIKIYTMGGSIDKSYSTIESAFVVGEPQVTAILGEANVNLTYEVEALSQVDSLDMTDRDRKLLLSRVRSDPNRYILITHGTDTMLDTARVLVDVPGKVIVLTGAMQPAAFKQSDAAFNIGCAVIAVQTLPYGVYVVMNGRIFDPHSAKKNPKLDRFESI